MPKIVYVFRDGYDAQYLLPSLTGPDIPYETHVILETGALARKKKLKRILKSYPWYRFPQMVADLGALWLYDKVLTRQMQARLGFVSGPLPPHDTIDDINEPRALELLRGLRPNLIVVYGVGILTRKTLEALPCEAYNIHSSVLPYYKNVHSDFWAFCNDDLDKIGITIFKLDPGVDTGSIALQRAVQQVNPDPHLSLADYKCENLQLIRRLVPEFLSLYFAGKIQLRKQEEVRSLGTTPKLKDFLRYRAVCRTRKVR